MNIEVMHLYAHDLMRPKPALAAARAAWHLIPGGPARNELIPRTICALVDDYNSELAGTREEAAESLIWYAAQEGILLDYVAFEADCAREADLLIEQAGITDGWLRRDGEGHSTAVRVRDAEYVACPTLAAVWMLARLGEQPYLGSINLYNSEGTVYDSGFPSERLLTILPVMYIQTEATVYTLLRATGHDVKGKISYAFH